jgi:hypothetical protein
MPGFVLAAAKHSLRTMQNNHVQVFQTQLLP